MTDDGRLRARLRPFRSWTLLTRLVVAVVALLAVVSAIIGGVSVLVLQGYLTNKLDAQLAFALAKGRSVIEHNPIDPLTGESSIRHVVGGPGQSRGTLGAVIDGATISIAYVDPSATTKTLTADLSRELAAVPSDGKPHTVTLPGRLDDYRVASAELPTGQTLVMGLPLADVRATTAQLGFVILCVTLAGLALIALAGAAIVRLALRPLARVTAAAQQVSELPLDRGDVTLSVRVPETDTDPHTEVGQVGSALNHMLSHVGEALAARQASEQKVRQFVADASHELRTPLASIRGYAELTRRGQYELPRDVTHSVARIESEAARMTSLVEDLLLLARLDEGRSLRREPVDLSTLLIDAVSDAHAAGPGIRWDLKLPDEPVEVRGDNFRLHQVVANLLANARVHTGPGTTVVAELALSTSGELAGSGQCAVITVTDDGPGIPAEVLPSLFERFARGDSSRSRATGSTGLGLAIVRAVVAAHHGSVGVQSEPGRTVFRVELPLAVAELPLPLEEPAAPRH